MKMVILTYVRLHLVELLENNYDEVEFIKGNLRDATLESFKGRRCHIPLCEYFEYSTPR